MILKEGRVQNAGKKNLEIERNPGKFYEFYGRKVLKKTRNSHNFGWSAWRFML